MTDDIAARARREPDTIIGSYGKLRQKHIALKAAARKACSRLDEILQEGDGMPDDAESGEAAAIKYARNVLRRALAKEDKKQ